MMMQGLVHLAAYILGVPVVRDTPAVTIALAVASVGEVDSRRFNLWGGGRWRPTPQSSHRRVTEASDGSGGLG